MAVNKLTQAQKEMIRLNYTSKRMNITEMAKTLEVSTRTIGRVLDELDLPSPAPRLKGEAYNVMQVMKKHGITADKLDFALTVASKVDDKPDLDKITSQILELSDGTYNAFLAQVIHQREAKKQNVHVQTAMLNLQEKAAKNERDTKEGNI